MTFASRYGIVYTEEKERTISLRETFNGKEVRQMEDTMLTIKFVVLYGLEVFVVAVVGATVIAGLYQLIRDRVRGVLDKVRERRAPAPAAARKS
jgi:hypothetical protein